MPAVHTTPAPAAPTAGKGCRKRPLSWINSGALDFIAGSAAFAAILTAGAIAVWPTSDADKARTDGERLGQAVSALYRAQSQAEADAALTDIETTLTDTREHAGDAVADQVDDQADALDRAVDGFAGTHTSDDSWDVDLYQAELDTAVDDLADQADAFRTQGSEVQQAFWDGYRDGLDAA